MSPRPDGDAGPGPHGAVLSGERPVPADLPLSLPIASARVRPGAADCFGGRLPARLAPWAEDIETNWTHLEVAGPDWALRALCAWRVVDGAGRMVTSGFECRGDEDLAPLVGRRAVRAVVSPVGQVADLDLRLDDGGRVQCFSDCASYEPWTLTMDGAIW